MSNKVWTVGQVVMDGIAIGTLIDPQDSEEGEQSPLMAIYDIMSALGLDPEDPKYEAET